MSLADSADLDEGTLRAFAEDVLDGLGKPQKTIPSRWLYDARGSALFERITGLAEYYPTATEMKILVERADEIAAAIGPEAVLVEYGAGAARKTRILLDALKAPAVYVPIDISAEFLNQTAELLRDVYPDLTVKPQAADFLAPGAATRLPDGGRRRVGFFPGSTVGNLTDGEIVSFLSRARRELGDDALFILGADVVKDPALLIPAYDDSEGVTAAFNRNLLVRINRELDGSFRLDGFDHEARWNVQDSRVEMHLVSRCVQSASVLGTEFAFGQGETIHTENSRKFDLAELEHLAWRGGWKLTMAWLDENKRFCVALLGEQ